ncbi:MAG: hypothetical protein Q4P33_06120 [Flaviflexus sp.]|nr:hypothetical protein [Flaviflexus sp.]
MEQEQRLAVARQALARAEATAGLHATTTQSAGDPGWHVPEPLAPLLTALTPGVVTVTGATSLALALAGAASAEGAWVAALGMPHLGWGAAAEYGLDLARTATIADPGPVPAETLAALADGFDIILAGNLGLTVREERRLEARLRSRSATLITEHWQTASRPLSATCEPVGCSDGHLTHIRLVIATPGGKLECRIAPEGLRPSRQLQAVPS